MILKAAFLIFMDIIDEIAGAMHYFLYEGLECNTVIIPESRREEIKNAASLIIKHFDSCTKHTVFGCEVIYSADADKIKVGYLK